MRERDRETETDRQRQNITVMHVMRPKQMCAFVSCANPGIYSICPAYWVFRHGYLLCAFNHLMNL